MASWEEAFLIFSRWEQEASLVLCSELMADWEEDGRPAPTLSGSQVSIDRVEFDPPSVKTSNGRMSDLVGATFEFALDVDKGESVCCLEVRLRDGRLFVFEEFSRNP